MKRMIRIVSVLLCISTAAKAQEIAFEHESFASVCARAKAENKLVFIDFYTSWCGPCKHMAETVFKQDNVGQYFNSHFISCKLDAEKGEGKTLAAKYHVQIYPTYLFLDDKGSVFNKAIGSCADTVFLGIAAKARQEYTNPGSLPRLKAQYAAGKKDTALLRRYIEKLAENKIHSFEEIEQYLSVQTAMHPGSPEMMGFIIKYPRELYYGGRAAQMLEKYSESYRKVADSGQREQLDFANNMLLSNTRIYAFEAKSETVLKRYIAAEESRSSSRPSLYTREGTWLDFYSATGNWEQYGPLAGRWLDSICSQLKPIAGSDEKIYLSRNRTPEELKIRRAAVIVCDHAQIYRQHFTQEEGVMRKALRWMKAALPACPDYSAGLTFYANLLYEDKDTAGAITTKIKALNSLPGISLHRNIVQTNLAHMQKGEPLEEE